MYYSFDLFLLILLMFYLFLFLLLIFYYIPFSSKPEALFLTMQRRFFRLSHTLLNYLRFKGVKKGSIFSYFAVKYSKIHLKNTVRKMQLWAENIDESYFAPLKKEELLAFAKACERFAYLLEIQLSKEANMTDNPLLMHFKKAHDTYPMIDMLESYAKGKKIVSQTHDNRTDALEKLEQNLKSTLQKEQSNRFSKEEMIAFYETLSLNIHLWLAFDACRKYMERIDMTHLERSRF